MALKVTKIEKPTVSETPCEWVDYQGGVQFKVYGISHPTYNLAVQRYEARADKEDILNMNEESLSFYTQIGIVGTYLVADWAGVIDENEKPLELNTTNFENFILNYPEALGFIMQSSYEVQKDYFIKLDNLKKKPSRATNTKSANQK